MHQRTKQTSTPTRPIRSGLLTAILLFWASMFSAELVAQTTLGVLAGTTGGVSACYFGLSAGQNSTGSGNSFFGGSAGTDNITGSFNTGIGINALHENLAGSNSAVGAYAMEYNNDGGYNAALGRMALRLNTSGSFNAATGTYALLRNVTGSYNTAMGYLTGPAIGLANLSNATALGYGATNTASNQVRIGNSAVSSIGGYANWSNISDRRFKENVEENVLGLDFINQLRPVSYSLNTQAIDQFLGLDQIEFEQMKSENGVPVYQTGFIAQEVEELVNNLGFQHFNGVDRPESEQDHYGIRYAEFVVPLVKAVQELSTENDQLKMQMEYMQSQLDDLSSQRTATSQPAQELDLAEEIALYQNSPNPFSSQTDIRLVLPTHVLDARVVIYNMKGQEVRSIRVEGRGKTQITLQANELEAGFYIYTLLTDNKVMATRQMILTR